MDGWPGLVGYAVLYLWLDFCISWVGGLQDGLDDMGGVGPWVGVLLLVNGRGRGNDDICYWVRLYYYILCKSLTICIRANRN